VREWWVYECVFVRGILGVLVWVCVEAFEGLLKIPPFCLLFTVLGQKHV
jgi:hypothetical protein